MSGTSIAVIPSDNLPLSKYGTDDVFGEVSTSSGWLPRLQLFGSNSDLVKQGKIPMAHYGLVLGQDQLEDLGEKVDVVPISWRPKAMRMKEGGSPLSYFNPKSEEFLAAQRDSEVQDSRCMFGPEFLIWIPTLNRVATYFMSSKTSRRQAPELRARMGRAATLHVQFIKTAKYSWHGPTVTACSTPYPSPDLEKLKSFVDSFNNPEDSSVDFDPERLEEGVRDR
jgi:hypothetical protein